MVSSYVLHFHFVASVDLNGGEGVVSGLGDAHWHFGARSFWRGVGQ